MNAMHSFQHYNSIRTSVVSDIQKSVDLNTGKVSEQLTNALKMQRLDSFKDSSAFSDEDLGYYIGKYRLEFIPREEGIFNKRMSELELANKRLRYMKQPGHKRNEIMTQLECQVKTLSAGCASDRLIIKRLVLTASILEDELSRRVSFREADEARKRKVTAAAIVGAWMSFDPSVPPAPEAARTATLPAPVKKMKSMVTPITPKCKYKPTVMVMGGFGGLKEALEYAGKLA